MTLGHFEYALLFTLVALGAGASGKAVREELERRSGRRPTHGATYSVLARLEERGYVASWLGEATSKRGGRRPKHYEITPAGAKILSDAHAELESLADGLVENLRRLASEA